MAKVIILNGTSSVGKSSIANQIHLLSKESFLHFCMDNFLSCLSPRFDGLGKDHITKRSCDARLGFFTSDIETGYRIHSGPLGKKLFSTMPEVIATIASKSLNLVVPVVLDNLSSFEHFKKCLNNFETHYIYIDCNRDEIQKRELARGDRLKGTSLDLLDNFQTQHLHDFSIDSTKLSPKELAGNIIQKLNI